MPTPKPDKAARGQWGEQTAATFLQEKGYELLDRNWSCKAGEIDIVMRDADTLVFVEVRLRRATLFGSGDETVAWQKQQKLIRAAHWYMQATKTLAQPARFDVVSITYTSPTDYTIDHIDHAFAAG